MSVVILKYNSGNIRSVQYALQRLGVEAELSSDPERILSAEKVIFPGQGEASSTMSFLASSGLDEVIKSLRRPFLGICLGLQVLCRYSEEGDSKCLGIIESGVKRFTRARKVPQVGWNSIDCPAGPLFKGIPEGEYFYFVHSYYAELSPETTARCDYEGEIFSAAVSLGNFHGVQFHPEKSGKAGEKLLRNFLEMPDAK